MINRKPKRRSGLHGLLILGEAVAIGLAALTPVPARADLTSLKQHCVPKDAKDSVGATPLPFQFCDDKLPPVGDRR